MATTNVLGVYSPIFYAQEALIWLTSAMGMASRVHRGFEAERRSFSKGDTISIRRPSTFTALAAPSAAANLNTDTVNINLDQWFEVKFSLTDKELAYTGQRIIDDHIGPAANALADHVDGALCDLYADIPWYQDLAGANAVVGDVVDTRKLMFENKVPLNNEAMLHFMLNGSVEADLLKESAFTQWQGSGATGVEAQLRGHLGRRYGFEFFANQNVKTHTNGTASVTTLAINNAAGYAVGVTTVNLDAGSVTGTLVPGDVFTIAGDTQQYAITNTTTASGNAFAGVTFTPGLAIAAVDDAVVTLELDTHAANLAFHRDAFALAMVPLPMLGGELGANVFTAVDPHSRLSVRARLYYVGNSSEVHVALDMLYGVKTLNPNLAARMRS